MTGAGPQATSICIVADPIDRVHVALDGARRHLAERFGLIPEGEWRYVWFTDPPLFDWSDEEGKMGLDPPPVHGARRRTT